MESLALLWHQIVGVASMVSKAWLKGESETIFGTLLADDVGVGKMAQVMAFISFVQVTYESQQQEKPLAPILSKSILDLSQIRSLITL